MLNLLIERLLVIDPPELAHVCANLAAARGRDHGNDVEGDRPRVLLGLAMITGLGAQSGEVQKGVNNDKGVAASGDPRMLG